MMSYGFPFMSTKFYNLVWSKYDLLHGLKGLDQKTDSHFQDIVRKINFKNNQKQINKKFRTWIYFLSSNSPKFWLFYIFVIVGFHLREGCLHVCWYLLHSEMTFSKIETSVGIKHRGNMVVWMRMDSKGLYAWTLVGRIMGHGLVGGTVPLGKDSEILK